jgi:hypothetical protein
MKADSGGLFRLKLVHRSLNDSVYSSLNAHESIEGSRTSFEIANTREKLEIFLSRLSKLLWLFKFDILTAGLDADERGHNNGVSWRN